MNRIITSSCLGVLLAAGGLLGAAADDGRPQVRVAKFSGDRAGAVSYTFDDGLRDQYTLAVPMLNEVGFKGTFSIIPGHTAETPEQGAKKQEEKRGWGGISWPELKEMAGQGHEIANHTWSHRGLPTLSPEEVVSEFIRSRDEIARRLGKPPLTLAFPFNQSTPEILAVALESHVACRTYQTGMGGKSTAEQLNAWADKQARDKTWGVLMAHAIARGYAAFGDPEVLRAHLRHVRSRERDIWVDTFANVARYEKERDNAKLEVSGSRGNFTCQLKGQLDSRIFDVPLTLVVEAPEAVSAKAERGGKELPTRVGNGFIQIDAVPDDQPIAIIWK